jgi:hypothetical protein
MWENTIVIHSILKEKKLQSKIFNQLNIKKIKSTKIILKKINKKKRKSWKKKKVILKKKIEKKKEMHYSLLLSLGVWVILAYYLMFCLF